MPEATFTLPRGAKRRELLTAGAFTALAGIATAAIARPETLAVGHAAVPHPDAELIALCGRFDDLERLCRATFGGLSSKGEEAAEAARRPWEAEQDELLDQIIPLQATTLAGFRARARTWASWDGELQKDGETSSYWQDRMAWALVRDLIAEAGNG